MGTRGRGLLVAGGAAIALGAAGWLLGPGWAAAGVVVGPFAALVIASAWQVHADTSATDLLRMGRADEALWKLDGELASLRTLARIWPGQFRDVLASRLVDQSFALHRCGRDEEAAAAADEAVLAFRELAAARPRKFTAVPADQYPYSGAQALLVEGRVLCDLSRQREAARPLARGWQLAASRDYQDLLGYPTSTSVPGQRCLGGDRARHYQLRPGPYRRPAAIGPRRPYDLSRLSADLPGGSCSG